ncbi:MAG TPA: hypothetical protein VNN17_07655 [Terriglobia bacterium]|nr:hypothetical protein [Terriglobia bacterium]
MRQWPLILALLAASPAAVRGATLVPLFLDDLTAESQTVVYGKVVGSRVEWDAGHTLLYTVYTVAPAEYLKGHLGALFELRQPGGELDDIGMKVAGAPHFSIGQEALLFVWTSPRGDHQVAGFEQGVVRIFTDPATGVKSASRSIPLGSARGLNAVAATRPGTSRRLPQLLEQVRGSIAKSRPGRLGQ